MWARFCSHGIFFLCVSRLSRAALVDDGGNRNHTIYQLYTQYFPVGTELMVVGCQLLEASSLSVCNLCAMSCERRSIAAFPLQFLLLDKCDISKILINCNCDTRVFSFNSCKYGINDKYICFSLLRFNKNIPSGCEKKISQHFCDVPPCRFI